MVVENTLWGVPRSDAWSVKELLVLNHEYPKLSPQKQWEVRQFLLPNCWEALQEECITPLFGFWCKDHHIELWFEEHVMCGFGGYGAFTVSIEQLVDLYLLCKQVLKDPQQASRLLWTLSIYDGEYFRSTARTMRYLRQAVIFLREHPDYCGVYYVD